MSYIPMIISVCIGLSIANIITYFIRRLMISWRRSSKLDCVKKYGLGHKIGHILGVNMISRCFMVIGEDSYNDREAVKHYLLKGYTVEEIASMTPMTLYEVASHVRYWKERDCMTEKTINEDELIGYIIRRIHEEKDDNVYYEDVKARGL